MPSISYQLIKLIFQLKGVKRSWSQSPVNYQQHRREDLHSPTKRQLRNCSVRSFRVKDTLVTELLPQLPTSDKLILYCPGGAFIYGPTELNWKFIVRIAQETQSRVWLIDYPKAPETKINQITENIDEVYATAIKSYDPSSIILLGDSVGGNLLLTLTQRLIESGKPKPSLLIAVTPVADASMTNPGIEPLDQVDPILSRPGVLSAKVMCAGGVDLKDPVISPLYGSFKNFPRTYLFVATHDILYPDQKLLIEKMKAQLVEVEVIEGKGMPHIWPLLPVMTEAKAAIAQIARIISATVPDYHLKP